MDPAVRNEASYCTLTAVLYCLHKDVHTLHQHKCCKTQESETTVLKRLSLLQLTQKYFQTHWSISVTDFYIVSCQCLQGFHKV